MLKYTIPLSYSISCFFDYKPKNINKKFYTKEELLEYNNPKKKVLVSYKDNVYNITEFIKEHPGGSDKIMLAAGKSIDEYWFLYPQHEKNALQLLDSMKVGKLKDYNPISENKTNLYKNEPKRSDNLRFHTLIPCNAENPLEEDFEYITDIDDWYIRNHHPVPDIKLNNYKLEIKNDLNSKSKILNYEYLTNNFKSESIITTIQCGGNRRNELKNTNGTKWYIGAISTAKWTGVKLYDVLEKIEPDLRNLRDKHIILESYDGLIVSIPIEKVLNPIGNVLLAYKMNDKIIPRDHGYPLRVIVPGYVGIRNVKWIKNITISEEEAESNWQIGIAYKGLPHYIKDLNNIDLGNYYTTNEMPVQSCITYPKNNQHINTQHINTQHINTQHINKSKKKKDKLKIQGYALSGGGRGIIRVDVSIDGGDTWQEAELKEGNEQNKNSSFAWTLWECIMELPKEKIFDDDFDVINDISTFKIDNKINIKCKATDISYNTQPENKDYCWNIRGINNNYIHNIEVFL